MSRMIVKREAKDNKTRYRNNYMNPTINSYNDIKQKQRNK